MSAALVGGSPRLGGHRRRHLQGTGERDGRLHQAGVVMYHHLSKRVLKTVDEEADLVLSTGDVDA